MHRAVHKESATRVVTTCQIYCRCGVRFTIARHNLLNVKNRNTKKRYERFTKLTIKAPEIVCACRISRGDQEKIKNFRGR